MKFLAVIFVLAFVAVQFSCSAPTPDEDKKEESPVPPARTADTTPPHLLASSSTSEQNAAHPDPAAPVEEKKA